MLTQLETHYSEALKALESINDSEALHEWQIKYIGRRGLITEMLRSTGSLPQEERASFGQRANEIKNLLTTAHAEREALIAQQELARDLEEGEIDISLPGRRHPQRRAAPGDADSAGFRAHLGGHGLPGLPQPRS